MPAAASVADEREQPLDALPRQEDRRLVEDQQAVAAVRPQRISSIARTIASSARSTGFSVGDGRARVEAHAVALERLARARALAAPGDAEARARRGDLGDAQVLEHAQRLDEPEVLVHEAHPELAELPRRERQPDRLAVDQQLAGVGLVEAGEHLDQRRLAGAVLPEEAVDLPGENVEVDAAQRLRPAEALRQAPQRRGAAAARRRSLPTSGPRASCSRRRTSCPSRA